MDQHLADLAETFDILRQYHIKLNPAKCTFGVRSGKFLRFISRFTECSLPFFKAARKIRTLSGMKNVSRRSMILKAYLANLPLLTKPTIGELLYLYLIEVDFARAYRYQGEPAWNELSSIFVPKQADDQRSILLQSLVTRTWVMTRQARKIQVRSRQGTTMEVMMTKVSTTVVQVEISLVEIN
ncbi:hypothetical protein Sango_2318300 [Sesamum angolense]|uniref:Reverse transcriptase domain-containing protein n=1 Tax=Sesamum angolense TaxID=2727404 RepID=A0AAE1WAL8_9LAMI|nr:hypothetical protein Sango_2318300 [Sesamum angolense]